MKRSKDKYVTKVTSVEGYCGKDHDDKLEELRKEIISQGGYIKGVVPIKSIIIYDKKVDIKDKEYDIEEVI